MSSATEARSHIDVTAPRPQRRPFGRRQMNRADVEAALATLPASPHEARPAVSVLQMQLAGIRSHADATDQTGMRGEVVAALQEWCSPSTDGAEALDFACRQISLLHGFRDELSVSIRAAWRWAAVEVASIVA